MSESEWSLARKNTTSGKIFERARAIAAKLKSAQTDDVSFSLNAEDLKLFQAHSSRDFSVSGNKLHFSDLSVVSRLTAEHYYFTDGGLGEAGDPINVACKIARAEGCKGERAAGHYLALVNANDDVFLRASVTITEQDARVFEVLDVIQASLPHIDTPPVASLLALCEAQYSRTKNDILRGRFFNEFANRFKSEQRYLQDIVIAVRPTMTESSASLYTMGLMAVSETDVAWTVEEAINDVSNTNPQVSANAIWVLGRLLLKGDIPASDLSEVNDILKAHLSSGDELVKGAARQALTEGAFVNADLEDALDELLKAEDQNVLKILSASLFYNSELTEKHPSFQRWVGALTLLSHESAGGMENFDMLLHSMISKGHADEAMRHLETWLGNQGLVAVQSKEIIDLFKMTFHYICWDKNLRSRLITNWLVSEDSGVCLGAEALLGKLHLHKIGQVEFDHATVTKFKKNELVLLVKRLLGFVIYDDQLLPLTLSILKIRKSDPIAYGIVEEVLTHEIGADFPHETMKRVKQLKSHSKDVELKSLCERVAGAIDSYFGDLDTLVPIKELKPDRQLAQAMTKQQAKVMDKHYKAAQKDAIFNQIATVIPLKAGLGSFSYRSDDYDSPSYLHSFEHSVSFPRRHVLDKVGYEMTRRMFRVSKLEEE